MSELPLLEKIPTEYLPSNWREKGMAAFNCKGAKIERIVYGMDKKTPKNLVMWEFMLALAEDGKKRIEALDSDLAKRLKDLVS